MGELSYEEKLNQLILYLLVFRKPRSDLTPKNFDKMRVYFLLWKNLPTMGYHSLRMPPVFELNIPEQKLSEYFKYEV